MISNLKCPFCQQELYQDYTGIMYCCNEDCEQSADWYGSQILWQELAQVKQDLKNWQHNYSVKSEQHERGYAYATKTIKDLESKLEIATKALEKIISDYEVDASNGWLAANAKKALEQIKK